MNESEIVAKTVEHFRNQNGSPAAQRRPVSESALAKRIRRKLAQEGEVLRAARGERTAQEFGRYFLIDLHGNYVVAQHVDLETLGREMGVLGTDEELQSD